MAPSLRDLIDFLLAEIALCGSQGASPADVLSFIDVFYAKVAKTDSGRSPVIDRRFQEKVWQWLTRNPEVHVGKDREWNSLTLEEAELRQPRKEDGDGNGEVSQSGVKVFVSEKRTWLAITGHEPDDSKVLPMEFALLSIIASRKTAGITQPELIKLSGQDKRSVPKRTDVLQQKGYIEKRAIQIRAARTSLCTLRQFLTSDAPATEGSGITGESGASRMIDFRLFTNKLFEVLRDHKIIARNDLKVALEFNDHWRWRVLSRALRKFERIGVLKRVRALSQYATTMKKYHPCVMLVREPTEKDIEDFHDFSISMYADIKQAEDAGFEDDAEAEDAGEPTADLQSVGNEGDVEVSGRVIPSWSPDRSIHSQLFEAIDRTGTMGSTNNDVIRACFGVFYRRPVENTLTRLSECWQLSQPPHLRHLALVRDTALQRTITHYVHYSARNFNKLVEAGDSSWEAVVFAPRQAKATAASVPPVDAKPQLDVHGLPMSNPASELVKSGDCTLADCMWVVKPKDYNCSSSDPKAVKSENGTFTIHYWIKGVSGLASSGRESAPDTPVKSEDEGISTLAAEEFSTPIRRPPKKPKISSVDLTGMSEKEKLDAMGMDESWSEYKVVLLERPGTGVYVTARGKRRPAGKERGRPPASRIAIFKSPKLQDIPWFSLGNERSHTQSPAAQSPAPATSGPRLETTLTPVRDEPNYVPESNARGTKRSHLQDSSTAEFERASKLPRAEDPENGVESPQMSVADGSTIKVEAQTPSRTRGKRKRTASPEIERQGSGRGRKRTERAARPTAKPGQLTNSAADENQQPSPRFSPGADHFEKHPQLPRNEDPASQTANEIPAESNTVLTPKEVNKTLPASTPGTANKQAFTANGTPASFMSPTPNTSAARGVYAKFPDKGGSVALLRRNIVMGLLEKAGGAFPMGTELWYPFVTAWMKTKYKERPDMRTLRATVKNLVDAGKVRQQTFCGKDSKGIMVTKTIVCKSSLPPDDPVIKDMQERILTTEARHYFPPGVEVDPNLTKSGSTPKVPRKTLNASMVPVEPGMTVQLHQKPAVVKMIERRRGEAYQRRLNERMEIERMRQSMQEVRPSGVIRLLSLQRPDSQDHGAPLFNAADPMFGAFGKLEKRQNRVLAGAIGRSQLKRLRHTLSLMSPYAMLMSPTQSFNPVNGTFSTNAGPPLMMPKHLQARLAREATSKPASMMMNPAQTFNPTNGTFSTDAGPAALIMIRHRKSHKADPHLPHSIDDQLMQAGRRNVQFSGEMDTRSANFIRDNNAILRWELQNEALLQQRSEGTHYINQGIDDSFQSAPIEGGIRFDDNEWETDIMLPPQTPTRRGRRRQVQAPEPLEGPLEEPLEYPRPMSFIQHNHGPFPPESYRLAPQPRMRHYRTPVSNTQPRRIERLNKMMAVGSESALPSQEKPLYRRNRTQILFSSSAYQKLMAAIVAVRALAGGADGRNVDWSLIPYCFPGQDPKLIQDKGRNFLAKNRLQVAKMQSDFQERFVDAYANNEVPPIDYNNLEGYNWEAVIEWINTNLDVPKSDSTTDLPATREQFDDIFELREDPIETVDEIYSNQNVTLNRKRMLVTNVPFAVPLSSKPSSHSQRHQELSRFDTLKTWVRANVFTPAEVYNASDARSALARVDNGRLNTALQSLVTERVVLQANKGRVLPGRNYDISDHFIQTLSKKRPIEATEIRRACKFKTDTLDIAFAEHGVYDVPFGGEDGDFLALINLFREGRIILVPRDAPRDKFGLTEGGYLTRMINKDKLRFPVEVRPVPGKYVNGNPISEKVSQLPPPCPPRITVNFASLPEKFPLWYDIHGNVIRVLWELSIAAVLGTVAMRPGITPEKIASMIKPTMGAWEVQMVLEWLAEIGIVRKRGDDGDDEESCWYTMEWWWMIL